MHSLLIYWNWTLDNFINSWKIFAFYYIVQWSRADNNKLNDDKNQVKWSKFQFSDKVYSQNERNEKKWREMNWNKSISKF
jgi:hypothetical protein